MAELDEIINVTIQVDSTGVAKEVFGIGMILSHNAAGPAFIKYYNSYADVLADYAADAPEALHAAAMFAQTPHPAQIAIGRATTSVTLKYAMSPITVSAAHPYAMQVTGQGVTPTLVSYITGTSFSLDLATKTTHFTTVVEAISTTVAPHIVIAGGAGAGAGTLSEVGTTATFTLKDSVSTEADFLALLATSTLLRARSAGGSSGFVTANDAFTTTILAVATVTNDEITSNLVALLNAVPGKNYTATQQGSSGSHTVQVLGSAAGDYFALAVTDDKTLKSAITNTGNPTADLNAVHLAANPDFYMVDTIYNSASYVEATAAWAEANGKVYIFDVPETDVVNATSTGSADTVDTVNASGYARTLPQYHPSQAQALSAALEGRIISLNPGLWTAAFKSLAGPTATKLTATQLNNLKAKRGNYYTSRAGRGVTLYGTVGSTAYLFLDIIVGLDFFVNDIQTSAFGVFAGADKIGYDDADIEQVASAIRGAIMRAYSDDHKIISRGTPGSLTDPIPSIVFPSVADIDPSVRALRQLPDGVLTCRMLGAVQSVAMRAVITF